MPEHVAAMEETLLEPDTIRGSARVTDAKLFTKWYNSIRGGKHVVVVVMAEAGAQRRNWVVTAYLARRLAGGEVEWKKN